MKSTETILDRILVDVRQELAAAQQQRSVAELKRMIADAPAVRSFKKALVAAFGLIGEIKQRSPSQGVMRHENVAGAAAAYDRSSIVHGFSVLTNTTHFGMSIQRLAEIKTTSTKPVLRKDFIFDEYQVFEARAFGADAILLMANLLEVDEMRRLFHLARELDMEALFECHDRQQIEQVPPGAEIYGINSRTFATTPETYEAARQHRQSGAHEDLTTNLNRFELGRYLPPQAIKVAESGISPGTVARLRDDLGYHAALVGTSLLLAPEGVQHELEKFERALAAKLISPPARD